MTTNQDNGVAQSPADTVSQTMLEVLVELVALRKQEAAERAMNTEHAHEQE